MPSKVKISCEVACNMIFAAALVCKITIGLITVKDIPLFFYFCIMIIFGEANFLDLPQVHVHHNNLTDPLSFLLPAGLDYFCPSWLLPFQSGHSTNRLERGTRERRALSGVKSPNTAPRPPVTSFPDAQGADGRCNNCQRKESGADLMAARLIEKTFTMYHWQNLDIHATLQS